MKTISVLIVLILAVGCGGGQVGSSMTPVSPVATSLTLTCPADHPNVLRLTCFAGSPGQETGNVLSVDTYSGEINFGYTVYDQNGQAMQFNAFNTEWTSTNSAVAYMKGINGSDLQLFTNSSGIATVTGSAGNASATINITVN